MFKIIILRYIFFLNLLCNKWCRNKLVNLPKNDLLVKKGTILQPINYIKPVKNPELNLEKEHLKNYNFFNYQEIPKEPVLGYDRCETNAKFEN